MKLEKLFLPFLLCIAAAILSIGIKKPFIGLHDWNGAVYSQVARNFLRYGYIKIKFGQILNPGLVTPQEFRFTTHYPLLFPIILSFFFKVFGINEWSARLVPISSSILMILYFYKLISFFWDKKTALFACLFLIFTPMFIYFAKMPVHEIINTGTAVITVYYYFLWLKKGDRNSLLLIYFLTFIREAIEWSGFSLTFFLLVHAFFSNRQAFKKLIGLIPLSILMFSLHLFYLKILTGSFFGGGFMKIALVRLGFNQESYGNIIHPGFLQFLKHEFTITHLYFTKILVFFAFLYYCFFIKKFFEKKADLKFKGGIVAVFFIFGASYGLIFRNALWYHDYLLFYALPFIALSSTLIIDHLTRNKKTIGVIIWFMVLSVFFTEKIKFTKAILLSDYEGKNYRICQFINKYTEKNSNILLTIFVNESAYFFNFYLDRKYKSISPKFVEFEKNEKAYRESFDYLVIDGKTDLELLKYLLNKYKLVSKNGVYYLINLKEQNR